MQKIYKLLFKSYGPQGWWPVTTNNRQFEIIIGAILTQNTSWKNVEKAIANLRGKNLVAPVKIAGIKKNELAKLIRPSGYYNQKAERLKIISDFVLQNKFLHKLPVDELREKLLGVKGVGPETADSIILYAFNKPSFVIDSYTKRIFSRLGFCSRNVSYAELQEMFHSRLPRDAKMFNEYHALIVEHAKRFCRKTPVCADCLLSKICKKRF